MQGKGNYATEDISYQMGYNHTSQIRPHLYISNIRYDRSFDNAYLTVDRINVTIDDVKLDMGLQEQDFATTSVQRINREFCLPMITESYIKHEQCQVQVD